MADKVSIKVKKTGRFKAPVLDNGVLTSIGRHMVETQKRRWAAGLNVEGMPAAPLAKPYMYRKAKYLHTNRPRRDMKLTGMLVGNFTLRKAVNGVIRAEPTSREGRKHAQKANEKDQMIGFSGNDMKTLYDDVQSGYGNHAKTMWVPIG